MGIFVVKHCITILCTKTAAGILEEEGMSWGSAADQTVIYPETFRGQPITGQVHVKVGRHITNFIKRQKTASNIGGEGNKLGSAADQTVIQYSYLQKLSAASPLLDTL